MARYSAVFVLHGKNSQNRDLASTNDRELHLIPKVPIESFWDGVWLGIQPVLCCIVEFRRIVSTNVREFNLMPKAPIESFWDGL